MSDVFTGFTPCPDCIRDALDPLAAMVFGVVWRFSQMNGGTCGASVATIAERAGIGTTPTRIRLGQLARGGWITATTRPGRTTTYRDSGRWVLRIVGEDTPTGNVGHPNGKRWTPQRETLDTPTPDVAEDRTIKKEPPRHTDADASVPASADAERGERESKHKAAKPKAKPDTDPRVTEVLKAYRDALGYSIPNGGREAAAAKWMLSQGYDCAQIMDAYRRMKAEPFWESRALSLQSVKGQIGEMTRRRSAITTSHTNTIPADVPPSWTFTDATGTVRLKAVSMVLADLGAHDADAMDPATWPDVVRAAYRAGIGGAP